jgi:hypothetical protein
MLIIVTQWIYDVSILGYSDFMLLFDRKYFDNAIIAPSLDSRTIINCR